MIRNEYSFNNTVSMRAWTKQHSGSRLIPGPTPKQSTYGYMHFQNPGPLSPNYVKPVSPVKKFLADLFKAVFKRAK